MLAYFKNSDGEMFFGGINGLNSFYPDTIHDNPYIPPVVFTTFKIYERESTIIRHYLNNDSIRLSYKDSVSFEFSSLDYSNPEKNQYAYMLKGLHEHWLELGNSHEITFANMIPGRYSLKVKGTNSSGKWADQAASIHLTITPPFWQTWWFRIIIVAIIGLMIFRWHFSRLKKQESRLKSETLRERFFIKNNISARERDVILLILKGKSNRDIEEELFISLGTVKNHLYSIYQKLNINSRVQLITALKNIEVDSD
jgi:DNA-binding CsgD family transcriptional regulator